MANKHKKTRRNINPTSSKTIRIEREPTGFDTYNFKWRISSTYIDYNHSAYGWNDIPVAYLLGTIVTRLHNLEGQTWAEIKSADNHCHSKEIIQLTTDLQNSLKERNLEHLEDLFQISVGSVPRIFGYREKQIFYPVWWDEKHKICPTDP